MRGMSGLANFDRLAGSRNLSRRFARVAFVQHPSIGCAMLLKADTGAEQGRDLGSLPAPLALWMPRLARSYGDHQPEAATGLLSNIICDGRSRRIFKAPRIRKGAWGGTPAAAGTLTLITERVSQRRNPKRW